MYPSAGLPTDITETYPTSGGQTESGRSDRGGAAIDRGGQRAGAPEGGLTTAKRGVGAGEPSGSSGFGEVIAQATGSSASAGWACCCRSSSSPRSPVR